MPTLSVAQSATFGAATRTLRQARLAVAVAFAANGFLFGSWVPRIPGIKSELGLSSASLGIALLAVPVGSLLSMMIVGKACVRFGSATVTRVGLAWYCAFAFLPGLAWNLPSLWIGLMIWGIGVGGYDVAMNAQGVTVEAAYRRPVLSGFHGAWSVGSLTGSLFGALGNALGMDVAVQQALFAAVLLVVVLLMSRWYLPDPPHIEPEMQTPGRRGLPELRLVLLGIAAIFALLSEGAVADWSGVLLRDHLQVSPGEVGLAYSACALAMTAGRFAGDRVVHALGRARSVAGLAILGAVGLSIGMATDTLPGVVIGFGVLGLGLSVMVPVFFSTSADGAAPGPAIATVSSFGYTGFLFGPTIIGFIAQATSVPFALWLLPPFILIGGALGIVAVRMTQRRAAIN